MEIGRNIAAFRKKAKLTQEELAEKVGVSAQSVSKWENGVNMPDILLLPKIAEELGTTINELFSENISDGNTNLMPYSIVPQSIQSTMLGIFMNAFEYGGQKADDVFAGMKHQLDKSERTEYELFTRENGMVRMTNSVSYVDMTFRKPEAGEVLLSDRAGELLSLLGERSVRLLLKAMYDLIIGNGKAEAEFFTEAELEEKSGLGSEEILCAMKKLESIQMTETYEKIENGKYTRSFCLCYGIVHLAELMVMYRLAYLFFGPKLIERSNRYAYEHSDRNTGEC